MYGRKLHISYISTCLIYLSDPRVDTVDCGFFCLAPWFIAAPLRPSAAWRAPAAQRSQTSGPCAEREHSNGQREVFWCLPPLNPWTLKRSQQSTGPHRTWESVAIPDSVTHIGCSSFAEQVCFRVATESESLSASALRIYRAFAGCDSRSSHQPAESQSAKALLYHNRNADHVTLTRCPTLGIPTLTNELLHGCQDCIAATIAAMFLRGYA